MNKKIKSDTPITESKKNDSVKSATHKTRSTHTKTDNSTALEAEEHSTELIPLEEQSTEQEKPTQEKITSIKEEPTPADPEKITSVDDEMPTPAPPHPESTEPVEPSEKPAETDKEIADKIHAEAALKEKSIDRQLEMLWANGRKQLLSQPTQHVKTMPLYPDNSPSVEATHKPIKQ